jgi:hypothetical protein
VTTFWVSAPLVFVFWFFFERGGFRCVAQAGLKLTILPQPPECSAGITGITTTSSSAPLQMAISLSVLFGSTGV